MNKIENFELLFLKNNEVIISFDNIDEIKNVKYMLSRDDKRVIIQRNNKIFYFQLNDIDYINIKNKKILFCENNNEDNFIYEADKM